MKFEQIVNGNGHLTEEGKNYLEELEKAFVQKIESVTQSNQEKNILTSVIHKRLNDILFFDLTKR